MSKIFVLVFSGKLDSVDYVKLRVFSDMNSARCFCDDVTKPGKYWVFAQIVKENTRYDLGEVIIDVESLDGDEE